LTKQKKERKPIWLIRDGLLSALLSLLVCYLLSLLFFNISFFNPLSKALEDFNFLDVYYSERLYEQATIEPEIVLLNVEQESREALATTLQSVLAEDPSVVGFDVILKELEGTRTDTLLSRLLKQPTVVSAYTLQESGKTVSHPFFQGQGAQGYANFNFGYQDAVIREFTPYLKTENGSHMAFSVALAKAHMPKTAWNDPLLEKRLQKPQVINYQGGHDAFMTLTLKEYLKLENKGLIKGKVVILGYLGTPTGNPYDVEDKHFTPLNKVTAGKSVPDMYGMAIHANILSMLLNDTFMNELSRGWLLGLTFLCSFLASMYFIWLDQKLKISYRTVRKGILFVFTVLMVWFTIVLFKWGIVLRSAPIIAVTLFSSGFIKYYKHLVRFVNTKWNFPSYYK
jgi:CHASE2 domain-containing sensor protein